MEFDDIFVTPDGEKYDMKLPNWAESRVGEIAILSPTKGPELMSVFSRACFILSRHLASIYLGYQRAQKATANRKAVVIIDIMPEKMADKKLASNDATRQAILDLDAEYSNALEKEHIFEAAVMYFKRKIEDMEGALSASKRVLADTEQVFKRPNYNMTDTGSETKVAPKPITTTPTGLRIGKAQY